MKEASGSLDQSTEIIQRCGDRVTVLSGDDSLTLPILAVGGKGVISVVSNIVPHDVSLMVEHFRSGQAELAAGPAPQALPAHQGDVHRDQPDAGQGGDEPARHGRGRTAPAAGPADRGEPEGDCAGDARLRPAGRTRIGQIGPMGPIGPIRPRRPEMRIVVVGCAGKMGAEVCRVLAAEKDIELVAGVESSATRR